MHDINARLAEPWGRPSPPPKAHSTSHGNEYFRWDLQRIFDGTEGVPIILPWLMLNPSKADHLQNDPTLLRIIDFTWRWGFDGLIVFNVYPHRTPSPAELAQHVCGWEERSDWGVRDQIHANHDLIRRRLRSANAMMAAWGSPSGRLAGDTESWVQNLLEEIDSARPPGGEINLWCLGRTKGGDPIHPLARGKHRVPSTALPQLYRDRDAANPQLFGA